MPPGQAQVWPERNVSILVPFAAGSTPDLIARVLADGLQGSTGKVFVVENRPGASGNTATAAVAKAGPARPRFAIWLPSIAVTMVADSPGVLSKIDVVEPPYIAP